MLLFEAFRKLILVAPSPRNFETISTAPVSVFAAHCRPYRLLDVHTSPPKLLNANNMRIVKNSAFLNAIFGSPRSEHENEAWSSDIRRCQ
jgi:hypothetical protein